MCNIWSEGRGYKIMDFQYEFVGDKQKQTFTKRNQLYTRKGYDIRVKTAEKFKRKCDYLGETQSRIVERLIEEFCNSTGWGPEVKSAPLDPKSGEHIKQSVGTVLKDFLHWGQN
jgi:hypothetical protein